MTDYLSASLDGAARDLRAAAKTLSGAAEELREEGRSLCRDENCEARCGRPYSGPRSEPAPLPFSLASVPDPTVPVELTEKELRTVLHALSTSRVTHTVYFNSARDKLRQVRDYGDRQDSDGAA